MQHTKIPAGLAVFMVATVADALHATHQAGICHRDVNPAWILLDANGNAKLVGAGLTYFLYVTNDAFVMSLMRRRAHLRSYLAPEQLDPDLPTDYLADIYSLGAIVYHLLVGNPPGGLTVLPSSRGEVGQGTDDVVLKSLHRDPHSRYKTAKAFGDEVRRIGGAIDNSRWWQWQQNLATTESKKARKFRRFSRKTVIIALASCVFFGVGIFLFVQELVRDTKLPTEQLTKSLSNGIVSQEKREEALAVMASIVHKAVASTWDGSKTDAVEQSARVAVMTGNQMEVADLARLCLDKTPQGSADAKRIGDLVNLIETGAPNYRREMAAALPNRVKDPADALRHLVAAAAHLPNQRVLINEAQPPAVDAVNPFIRGDRLQSDYDPLPALVEDLNSLTGGPDGAPAGYMVWKHGLEIHVDLANNPELKDLKILGRHPITHLDLSRTAVENLAQLAALPLKVLHLDHTKVVDLTPLVGTPLRVLTAEGNEVSQLATIPDAPYLISLRVGVAGGELKTKISAARPLETWVNDLGQRFQPLGDSASVLVSEFETRVSDYRAFVEATNRVSPPGVFLPKENQPAEWAQLPVTWDALPFAQQVDHPVVGVSRDDAAAYCRWLTERHQAAGLLSPTASYRLPTNNEWSLATGMASEDPDRRFIIISKYCWGEEWPPTGVVGNFPAHLAELFPDVKPTNIDSWPNTAPVGLFRSQALLRDMGGNVREWTATSEGLGFIVRDAGWGISSAEPSTIQGALELSSYAILPSDARWANVGFRIVLDLSPAALLR